MVKGLKERIGPIGNREKEISSGDDRKDKREGIVLGGGDEPELNFVLRRVKSDLKLFREQGVPVGGGENHISPSFKNSKGDIFDRSQSTRKKGME